MKRPAKGLTIGIPKSFYVDDLEPDVAKALDDAIAIFKKLGVKVVQVDLPDQVMVSAAAMIVLAVEAATYHAPWLRTRPDDYGAQVRNRLQNGLAYSAVEYLEALRWRAHALEAHLAAIGKCDAVLAPVSRAVAPTLAETDVGGAGNAEAIIQGITRFMRPINYLGLPALVVPAGFGQRDMPIGLQIIGRPFNDETARGARHRVPGRDRPSHQGAEARMTPIVEMKDLRVRFKGERTVHALNGVDITLQQGEVLGLLGESGSGKSVTLRALLRMLPPKRSEISGTIRVGGEDVLTLDEDGLEKLRGGTVSMIFQEPMLALDPVYTIGDQIAETVTRHLGADLGARARSARSRCSKPCAFRRRSGGSRPIRTKCPAACASAP